MYSGAFWKLLRVCVCVCVYACACVLLCLCVLEVGAIAFWCYPLCSFELHADAKTPELSENPCLGQIIWINPFI